MHSKPFCSAIIVIGMLAACSANYEVTPLPEVSEATITPMATAFEETPLDCRMAVQRSLRRYELYGGPVDGQWSADLGKGLIDYVHSTGNLAYGWPSVPGSLGILWNISEGEPSCPNEALPS